jgi:hypothetical protein
MASLKEVGEANCAILPLMPDLEDQGLDVGRSPERMGLGSALPIKKALRTLLLVSLEPVVELRTRDAVVAAGLADVTGNPLIVLDHAEPRLGAAGTVLIRSALSHPNLLSTRSGYDWPTVREKA